MAAPGSRAPATAARRRTRRSGVVADDERDADQRELEVAEAGARPASSEASSTSTLTGVPVSASIEPECAPKTSGIRSCDGGRFSRTASTTTTGNSAATAPLTLISAERTPTNSIISTISRHRLSPGAADQHLPGPRRDGRSSRAPRSPTNSEVTNTVAGSPNPRGSGSASGRRSPRAPERTRGRRDDWQPVPDEQADDGGDDGKDDPDVGSSPSPAAAAPAPNKSVARPFRKPIVGLQVVVVIQKRTIRVMTLAPRCSWTGGPGGHGDQDDGSVRRRISRRRSSRRSNGSATRCRIPAIIFFWLIGLVVLLSVILSLVGWSATYEAVDPVTHEVVTQTTTVRSLLSADGIRFLVTSLVPNFLGFGAVGVIIVAMIGVGVAEEFGLIATLVRKIVEIAPPLDLHLHHRDARRRLVDRRRRRLPGAGAARRRGLPQPRPPSAGGARRRLLGRRRRSSSSTSS